MLAVRKGAYPQLQSQTHECLAVNIYLKQIGNPQVAFAVRQKQPANLDEAITATLEMEAYLDQSGVKGTVGSVSEEGLVAATSSQQDSRLLTLVEKLVDRVEKLEQISKENTLETDNRVEGFSVTQLVVMPAGAVGGLDICRRTVPNDQVKDNHLVNCSRETRYPRHDGSSARG